MIDPLQRARSYLHKPMPRVLRPSPNEEAAIRECQQRFQKVERLKAARKQSVDWCRKKTSSHVIETETKSVNQQLKATKLKLCDLEEKENNLSNQLQDALSEYRGSIIDAEKREKLQLNEKKKAKASEDLKIAAARHKKAIQKMKASRQIRSNEESKPQAVKQQVREKENDRAQRIREEPLEHSQPLVDVPTVLTTKRSMGGLDAFTKTYYHLPSGVGVVDEKSMGAGKDARRMAKEAQVLMEHCRDQLAESVQARTERAEVRGTAALNKVQLQNVLQDITGKLDLVASRARMQKKPSSVHTHVFASILARQNTAKQHQVHLEHAVEDIFDNRRSALTMVLPSSKQLSEKMSEASEEGTAVESSVQEIVPEGSLSGLGLSSFEETIKEAPVNETLLVHEGSPTEEVTSEREVDPALESRPSLSLYFPVRSDISSEQSNQGPHTLSGYSDCSGSEVTRDLTRVTEDNELENTPGNDITNLSKLYPTANKPPENPGLDLSSLIRDQLQMNKDLRALARPLKTSIDDSLTPSHPPMVSFSRPSANSSTSTRNTAGSSFEQIVQELLSDATQNTSKGTEDTSNGIQDTTRGDGSDATNSLRERSLSSMSGTISHHTLSSMSQHTMSSLRSDLTKTSTPNSEGKPGKGLGEADVSKISSLYYDKHFREMGEISGDSSMGGVSRTSKLSSAGRVTYQGKENIENTSRLSNGSSVQSKGSKRGSHASSIASFNSADSARSKGSGLRELQDQLARINGQLSEIGKIKNKDDVIF